MKMFNVNSIVVTEALGLFMMMILLILFCLIVCIYIMRKKIDGLVRKTSPIYLGIAYSVVIGFWIGFDDPIISTEQKNFIPTKLQTYQTLIASIGAVFIALIAYVGATSSVTHKKEQEEIEALNKKNVIFPKLLCYQVAELKNELIYIERLNKDNTITFLDFNTIIDRVNQLLNLLHEKPDYNNDINTRLEMFRLRTVTIRSGLDISLKAHQYRSKSAEIILNRSISMGDNELYQKYIEIDDKIKNQSYNFYVELIKNYKNEFLPELIELLNSTEPFQKYTKENIEKLYVKTS